MIPAMPTAAFKEWELSCLPAEQRTAVFHSSGTTAQQQSRHFHSADSLSVYEASLLSWFNVHLPLGSGNRRLVMLTPPPEQAPHSSLVHMFDTIQRSAAAVPAQAGFVGKLAADGAWALDMGLALEALQQAVEAQQPVLLLGTAFSFVHLLDHLAEQRLRFELPPGSCAMETGGYKGRSRELPKTALHNLISQRLGIPVNQIVCEYGMSELSSQAYDRAIHDPRDTQHAVRPFRFPPWARAQVISPETGCEVAEGETGLLRIFDLANVYSVMAIQTEDLAVRRADGFSLLGRATLAEPRGCSLMVA